MKLHSYVFGGDVFYLPTLKVIIQVQNGKRVLCNRVVSSLKCMELAY